jgi:hypothetical protein
MAIISLITSALGPESGIAGCRCGQLDDPQSASVPTRSPLRRDSAHPSNICTRTGLTPATSAPRLGSHPCAETGLTPPTSAPGLRSALSHLNRDSAHPRPPTSAPGLRWMRQDIFGWGWLGPRWGLRGRVIPAHICAGTGLIPAHICAGTGLIPAHICAGTGLTAATSAPGLGPAM